MSVVPVEVVLSEAAKLSYYFGALVDPARSTEKLLGKTDIKDGTFLLRRKSKVERYSNGSICVLVLSVKKSAITWHFEITSTRDGDSLTHMVTNGKTFGSLSGMIEYYGNNQLSGDNMRTTVRLMEPFQIDSMISPADESSGIYVDHCFCGMPRKETELYDGWEVHRSTKPESYGMPYFILRSENKTTWSLPREVLHKCSTRPYFLEMMPQEPQLPQQN